MRYIAVFFIVLLTACTNQYKLFKNYIEDENLFLERFGATSKIVPKNAVIVLSNGSFKGFGGCNDYSGTYYIKKKFIHFKLNSIGEKVCKESYNEREYLETLVKTTNLLIEGKRVIFKDRDNRVLLVFRR